jgi:hypothetical protein
MREFEMGMRLIRGRHLLCIEARELIDKWTLVFEY